MKKVSQSLLWVLGVMVLNASVLAGSMMGSLSSMGSSLSGSGGGASTGKNMVMVPSVSYGIDTFTNSIGLSNGDPNVVSMLKWDKVHVLKGNIQAQFTMGSFVIEAEGSYGHILKGNWIDNDYAGKNETLIWSQSQGPIKGSMIDLFIGAGYKMGKVFTPMLGMFYLKKDYEAHDLKQTISNQLNYQTVRTKLGAAVVGGAPPAVGTTFPGKMAVYSLTFMGPWLGAKVEVDLSKEFTLMGDLKGLYGWYKGKGHWIQANKHFEDIAMGYGATANLGMSYDFTPSFGIVAKVGVTYFKIQRGDVKQPTSTLKNYFIGAKDLAFQGTLGVNLKL